MAATNEENSSQGDIDMGIPETSMTGQELVQQIASIVGHNQIALSENVTATSPIDSSPIKTNPTIVPMSSSTPISKSKRAPNHPADDGQVATLDANDSPPSPQLPTVYGELSILGYNGYIPNSERSGRRNKSKFLLCKRPTPNGIKKSEHYIVKQPQATKAIQDKDNYSISYTFSKSQTIIVEYKQDDKSDLFQIGRSSEEPIDFVVMDTVSNGGGSCPTDVSPSQHHKQHNSSNRHSLAPSSANIHQQIFNGGHNYNSEIASSSQHIQQPFDLVEMTRYHRRIAKVEEEMRHRGIPPYPFDPRGRLPPSMYGHISGQPQQMLLNYPQPNLSNLPPLMAEHFRRRDPTLFHVPSVGSYNNQHQQNQLLVSRRSNHLTSGDHQNLSPENRQNMNQYHQNNNSSGNNHNSSKKSHAAQSTISRFACRIIVERSPPYTARIYAAGFDSSKNIFLGEKATKWEQNNSIDGLTTNGVLLMHPKRGYFCESIKEERLDNSHENGATKDESPNNDTTIECDVKMSSNLNEGRSRPSKSDDRHMSSSRNYSRSSHAQSSNSSKDTNNNADESFEYGGVWREVSVDGGIYAIRESRSATQKGRRIEHETNILQDGTLIDLCGATLLWRSVDGFKSSPTKRTLEEKIDLLNASRPQCPVGLNTLVIPRKPILPGNGGERHNRRSSAHHGYKDHHSSGTKEHHSHSNHYNKSSDGCCSSQQPYVYLKCGHVQGYHDWGLTDKSNQRTCPICLSVGTVAKLSMGLEPSFYVDSGPLTHVFSPCGHMASERTIRYWTSIKIPHGTHSFHSVCPFCASPLASSEPTSTRLIFQEDLD